MTKKNQVLIGFLLLNIITGICSGISSLVLPLYVVSLGAGVGQVGLVRGISGIGALLMVLPSGILIDNYGSSRLFQIGTLLSTVTTVILAFFGYPEIVLITMLIQGFANSLRFTSLNSAFFARLQELGMNKSGWYRGSLSIGLTFVGPFLGGLLIEHFDYTVIYIIIAVITLLPGVLILLLDQSNREESQRQQKEKFYLKKELKEFLELFGQREFRSTVAIEGISTACFSTFAAYIVIYAVQVIKVSKMTASNYLIIEGSAYILAVFLLGDLLMRFQKRTLYLTSAVVMSLGLLVIGNSEHHITLLTGIILLGAGTGLLNILTFSNLGSGNAKKGKISSALSFCTSFGASIGPMVAGFAGELLGFYAIFMIYIPILLLVVLITQMRGKRIVEDLTS